MTDSFDKSFAICLDRLCVRIGSRDLERRAVQQKMHRRFFEDAAETAVHCQLDVEAAAVRDEGAVSSLKEEDLFPGRFEKMPCRHPLEYDSH